MYFTLHVRRITVFLFLKSSEWAILMIDHLWTLVEVQLVLQKIRLFFLHAWYERWSFCAQKQVHAFLKELNLPLHGILCAFVTETIAFLENSGMLEKSLSKLSYLKLNVQTNQSRNQKLHKEPWTITLRLDWNRCMMIATHLTTWGGDSFSGHYVTDQDEANCSNQSRDDQQGSVSKITERSKRKYEEAP